MSHLSTSRNSIIKCVVTKFDQLKMDNYGLTVMTFDAICYNAKHSPDDCTLMMQSSQDYFVSLMNDTKFAAKFEKSSNQSNCSKCKN